MRSIAEALDQEGKDYVVLSVDTPNVAARSLYERLGFVDAGRTLRTEVAALVGTDL
jgi:ribosomal protein S18 acetylase RimI-like enzyme